MFVCEQCTEWIYEAKVNSAYKKVKKNDIQKTKSATNTVPLDGNIIVVAEKEFCHHDKNHDTLST